MGSSLPNADRSDLVGSLEVGRPKPAKAGLPSDRIGLRFSEAVVHHYGSVKAAAFHLGGVDPSLMMREFKEGKFGRFDEHADADARAAIIEELYRHFGQDDPIARAKRLLREGHRILNELAENLPE